ncbi:MAG TPA: F0F1 ATP synthase subunit delta [Candidatus Omnitrophota bacterium]|nr:F0F1 ATP synthase subunit delta [Candidatus Omnitrophota bacterium]
MQYESLIIGFVVVQIFIVGVIVVWLRMALISSTEGAVNRLNEEIAKANARQSDLSKKLREADEELNRRRAEAKSLTDKMRADAQEQSKEEREKIISEARKESEDILNKAQNAKVKIRQDLEKEVDVKVIQVGMKIVNGVLSDKAKGILHNILVDEFIDKLKETRMDRINQDIGAIDVVTVEPLDDTRKNRINEIVKEKMGREVKFNYSTDTAIGGGVVMKFGSMALDGSVKNLIRQSATNLQEEIESRYT